MRLEKLIGQLLFGLALALTSVGGAHAETCGSARFAAAVDGAGASLRKFNADTRPQLMAKLERLAEAKGWKRSAAEEKGLDYLQDGRVSEFDARANDRYTHVALLDDAGS